MLNLGGHVGTVGQCTTGQSGQTEELCGSHVGHVSHVGQDIGEDGTTEGQGDIVEQLEVGHDGEVGQGRVVGIGACIEQ